MTNPYLDLEFKDLQPDQVADLNKKRQTVISKTNSESQKAMSLMPREYQNEIFLKAVDKNVIAVLDTGAGKTLISIMLIKHMLNIENEKRQKNPGYKKKVTFFLVERVPLVFQQEGVMQANLDARIEKMCGEMNVDVWSLQKWRGILDSNDICVMTAQIFLDILQRGFLSLEEVNLLIFDECHHSVKGHPFNLIMYQFYHQILPGKYKPKIFGMTASPIFSNKGDVATSIRTLETNLNSEVYTAANNARELANAVKKPSEPIIYYLMRVIDELPNQTATQSRRTLGYHEAHQRGDPLVELRFSRTMLTTLISNKIKDIYGYQNCINVADYISNNLGPWCCDRLWKVILHGAHKYGLYESPFNYLSSNKLTSNEVTLMKEAYALCTPPSPNPNIENQHLFTPKIKALIDCLRAIKIGNDFCGIIFVERRHTAAAIKLLIDSLSEFNSVIRSDILIGHGGAANNRGNFHMKFHSQNSIINKFRKGELNLMISTNVAEEGLDIQACNYVIRFDMFKTLPAYIQSRGRARRQDSKYIMLINQLNPKENGLLLKFKETEEQMKQFCHMLPADRNVATCFGGVSCDPKSIKKATEGKYMKNAYEIRKTGALLTLTNSIALVYHYCATLPADDFCNFKPVYRMRDVTLEVNDHEAVVADYETEGWFKCTLTLPINSDLKKIEYFDVLKDDAKMNVSLQACIALHKAGAIDDNLIPMNVIRKKKLAEHAAAEQDDNGNQIGSRGRENHYKKELPSFWFLSGQQDNSSKKTNEEGTNNNSATKLPLGPYYISYINIKDSGDIKFRKFCLITKKPLPDILDFEIFNYEKPFQVTIDTSTKTELWFQTEKQVEVLTDYMFALTRCVTNKEFVCPRENVLYLLAPLKDDNSIDWKELKKSISNDNSSCLPLGGDQLKSICKDAIVIDYSNQYRRYYFVKHINEDMTLQSRVPRQLPLLSTSKDTATATLTKVRESGYENFAQYYQDQKDVTITDMDQPLLRASRVLKSNSFSFVSTMAKESQKKKDTAEYWLLPELCRLYCNSASVYQTSQIIPAIMSRIDATLLVQDAKKALNLARVNDRLLLEALTASSAAMNMNYQRLEFLGDSVLKFIASTHVFTQSPSANEDELTVTRMYMISNKALFQSAEKLHLYQYVCSQNLVPRKLWRPPNFTSVSDSKEMLQKMNSHKLSDKTLADVIESILGATFLSSDNLTTSMTAARQLGVPLDSILSWSDFNKLFLSRKHKSTYDPSLREVDVQRVSKIIGCYKFKDPSLVVEALTHASFLESSVPCYQRLEFLGDAVLDFCVTNYLFKKHGSAPPALLHDLRKSSVNNDILSVVCVQLKLQGHIRQMSDSLIKYIQNFVELLNDAKKSGNNVGEYWLDFNPPKVLSDVIESLIGAVYVDSGFDLKPAMALFDKWLKPVLENHISLESIQMHPVGEFKCIVQEFGCFKCELRNITMTHTTGPESQKCVVFIHNKAFTSGSGFNTKEARKQAASRACQRLKDDSQLLPSMCNCHEPITSNNA